MARWHRVPLDDARGRRGARGVDGRLGDARGGGGGTGAARANVVPDTGLPWLAALALRAEADAAERGRARRDDAAVAGCDRPRAQGRGAAAGSGRSAGRGVGRSRVGDLALCAAELARLDGQDGADPVAWEEAARVRPWSGCSQRPTAEHARRRRSSRLVGRGSRPRGLADARATALRLGAAPLLADVEMLARHARLDLAGPVGAGEPAPTAPAMSPAGGTASMRSASRRASWRCSGWCRRLDEPADRRCAVHHPQDRVGPRLEHPRQAGRGEPRRGGRDRASAGHRQGCAATAGQRRGRLTG